jgi:hypothetical protein
MTLEVDGKLRTWKSLSAEEYAAKFPAKPPTIRKIAYALKKLGANELPFTMNQRELAKLAGIGVRSWQRWEEVFEVWGILEVKRWRHREIGTTPNTHRTFIGRVIPPDWENLTPPFEVSPRERLTENNLKFFRQMSLLAILAWFLIGVSNARYVRTSVDCGLSGGILHRRSLRSGERHLWKTRLTTGTGFTT